MHLFIQMVKQDFSALEIDCALSYLLLSSRLDN